MTVSNTTISIRELHAYLQQMGFEYIAPTGFEKPQYIKGKTKITVCVPCMFIIVNGIRYKGVRFPVSIFNQVNISTTDDTN